METGNAGIKCAEDLIDAIRCGEAGRDDLTVMAVVHGERFWGLMVDALMMLVTGPESPPAGGDKGSGKPPPDGLY